MNYYTLHTPTGRIDVTKEVFDAVEHALSELQSENARLRVEAMKGMETDVLLAIHKASAEFWEREDARDIALAFKMRDERDELKEQLRKQSDLNRELSRENVDLRIAKASAIPVEYASVADDLGRVADVSQSAHVIIRRIVSQKDKKIEELEGKDHVCADSCAARLGNANASAARWKDRYTQLLEASCSNLDKVVVLSNQVRALKESVSELQCRLAAENEMETDVLLAIRKERG